MFRKKISSWNFCEIFDCLNKFSNSIKKNYEKMWKCQKFQGSYNFEDFFGGEADDFIGAILGNEIWVRKIRCNLNVDGSKLGFSKFVSFFSFFFFIKFSNTFSFLFSTIRKPPLRLTNLTIFSSFRKDLFGLIFKYYFWLSLATARSWLCIMGIFLLFFFKAGYLATFFSVFVVVVVFIKLKLFWEICSCFPYFYSVFKPQDT